MANKLKLFLSYAHEDEEMKNRLARNLIGLKRSDKIDVWQDRQIMPGEEWDSSIKKELVNADIILLLISVDFNNSQYIWDQELKIALDRHEKNEARVIPIILRPCDWSEMPYAKLQALPTGAKPVSTFTNQDEAYTDVAVNVRRIVEYLLQQKAQQA